MVVIALIALIRAIHAFVHQRQRRAPRETGLTGSRVVRRGQGASQAPRGSHAATDNSVDVPALSNAKAQQVHLSVALMDQPDDRNTDTSERPAQPTYQEQEVMETTKINSVPTEGPSRRTTDKGQRRPKRGAVRAWAARRPVAAFLVLAFAIAYPLMSLPVLADHGVIPSGWMPQLPGVDTERIASVLLVFGALLPASIVVTWAADGRAGVQALVSRMFQWRIGVGWWLLVLAGLPTLTLVFALLLSDTPQPVETAPFLTRQLAGLLVNLILINIWEETAWSGVVQSRLQQRHGTVIAAVLTAIPFALAHMPLHFIGDFTPGSLLTALITLLIICTLVRLMIGVFLRGTHGSILAVALLHTMFNRSNNDEGLVAGLLQGDGRKLAGLLAVLILTATIAYVSRRLNRPARTDRDSPIDQLTSHPVQRPVGRAQRSCDPNA